MKSVSAAFLTMLQTSNTLVEADLYTITLSSGRVLYYTSAQQNVTYNAHTYLAAYLDSAPGFERGSTKCAVGLQSDDLEVDILFDANTLMNGVAPAGFVAGGGLDNAVVRLDKALAPDWSNPVVNGVVNLFVGYVGEAQIEPGRIKLTVHSRLKLLNTSFPRNYFLPQDNNALFSAASGLTASTYAVAGTVTSTGGSPTLTNFSTNLTKADGWFSLGYLVWTSGANQGLTSLVKWYAQANGATVIVYPLPVAPAVGDTFTAYPGYDRTQSTCQTKFNNLANFRGFPYVPTPETLELGGAGSPPTGVGGGGGAGVGGIGRGPGGQVGRFGQL